MGRETGLVDRDTGLNVDTKTVAIETEKRTTYHKNIQLSKTGRSAQLLPTKTHNNKAFSKQTGSVFSEQAFHSFNIYI